MADVTEKGHESDSDNSDSEEVYTLDELTDMCAAADAVLGASDPHNCSYSLGYVKRQALYACMTCNGPTMPDSTKGGVCLACANKCHENHQLVELYTKRGFRCDCGNKKFGTTPCLLTPEKDATNVGNSYNHNFVGLYCTCERPYPDLEHPENDDEMIQCIVCEDWYHSKHAFGYRAEELIMGDDKEEDCEMICQTCTDSCDFLKHYEHLRVKVKRISDHVPVSETTVATNPEESEGTEVAKTLQNELKLQPSDVPNGNTDAKTSELKSEMDVESRAGPSGSSSPTSLSTCMEHSCGSSSSSQKTGDSGIALTESDVSRDDDKPNASAVANKNDAKSCILKSSPRGELPTTATLWISGWRANLCKCERCMNMYFKLGVSYIVDENDTLDAYEALGHAKREEEEKEDEAELTNMWSKLDHVAKVEAMISINEMKEHMREFLSKYNGKVVRKRDAEEFAEELKAKRARRLNAPGDGVPPSSCR